MAQVPHNGIQAKRVYRKRYLVDRGVDLLNDPLKVSDRRSPLCLNMMRAANGAVEKRPGWRILRRFNGRINAMAFCRLQRHYGTETDDYLSFLDTIIVHAGEALYACTVTPELRKTMDEDAAVDSRSDVARHAGWILRYIAGFEPNAESWQIRNADENKDGKIDSDDADLLLKYAVRLLDSDAICVINLKVTVKNELSHIFTHEGAAYFMDGANFLRIALHKSEATFTVAPVRTIAYIPTTSISAYYKYPDVEAGTEPNFTAKDGVWQEGEHLEEANILSPTRINTLCADGLNNVYWLDHDCSTVTKLEIYKNINGVCTWAELDTEEYTVSEDPERCKSKVTFDTVPAIHPVTAGLANIRITFSVLSTKTEEVTYSGTATFKTKDAMSVESVTLNGSALQQDKWTFFDNLLTISKSVTLNEGDIIGYAFMPRPPIERCRFATKYGYFNDNRFFASGNTLQPNREYESGIDDPTYWPEHGWTDIGSTASPIQAYVHFGEALGILKADDKADAGVYVRTARTTESGDIVFPVQQGVPGIGAASGRCAANLAEDAVFAAKEGVYAIRLQDISKNTAVVPRAELIASALKMSNMGKSACVVWQGLYLLATDGKCYVADSAQRTGDLDSGHYQYDWYIWDNIPVRVWMELDGELWFGTDDGRLCKFNSDLLDMTKYRDGAEQIDGAWTEGTAIRSLWATKCDNFDTPSAAKVLEYNGVTILGTQFERSSIRVHFIADGVQHGVCDRCIDEVQAESPELLIGNVPQPIHINHRIGRFNTLQLVFENNELNEAFGLMGAEVKFSYGNDYRGRL